MSVISVFETPETFNFIAILRQAGIEKIVPRVPKIFHNCIFFN